MSGASAIETTRFFTGLFVVLCLFGGAAEAQPLDTPTEASASIFTFEPWPRLSILNAERIDAAVENSLSIRVVPKILELKTYYVEKEEPRDADNVLQQGKTRRHFDLLATSAYFDGALVAEGELAYSKLDSPSGQCECSELPKMLRLALKHRWGKSEYGAHYLSAEPGFVWISGTGSAQSREEGQLWVERRLGAVQIRGSIAQVGETPPDLSELRLTRTASTALNFNQPVWNAAIISSYSMVEEGDEIPEESLVWNHTVTGSYRPVDGLSLSPNLSLREERDSSTGVGTGTPSAAVTVVYHPVRNLLLTGGTSYSRSFRRDGSSDLRTIGAVAAVDWKLDKALAGKKSLSFNLKYDRQLSLFPTSRGSYNTLGAMLYLKVAGF